MDSIYANGSYASISALFGGSGQQSGHSFVDSMQRFTGLANIADAAKEKLMSVTSDYNFGSFARKVKSITNQMSHVFEDDIIKPLRTLADFQTAKPMMQRVLSANIKLKRLVLNGTCEGYDDYEYDNQHVGARDHNYQSVRNGVLCTDENLKGEERFGMTSYHNTNGLSGFSIYEKHQVNITFNNLEKSIDSDELRDPTSKWNELMK